MPFHILELRCDVALQCPSSDSLGKVLKPGNCQSAPSLRPSMAPTIRHSKEVVADKKNARVQMWLTCHASRSEVCCELRKRCVSQFQIHVATCSVSHSHNTTAAMGQPKLQVVQGGSSCEAGSSAGRRNATHFHAVKLRYRHTPGSECVPNEGQWQWQWHNLSEHFVR